MFMSYVRGDREADVRMGGSTARSQDGGNSQTRTACPTESSRRMLDRAPIKYYSSLLFHWWASLVDLILFPFMDTSSFHGHFDLHWW